MAKAVKKLHSLGVRGATALRSLLGNDSAHVRGWVAAEFPASGDETAKPVLEALASKPGSIGFDARIVLREYQTGRLRSPFGSDRG